MFRTLLSCNILISITLVGCMPSEHEVHYLFNEDYYDHEEHDEVELIVEEATKDTEVEAPASAIRLIFRENFTNNVNEWAEGEDRMASTEVRNGQYHFTHFRQDSSYYTTHKIDAFDADKDFAIQCSLSYIDGDGADETNYGLIFGHDLQVSHGFKFLISNTGLYEISRSNYGDYEVIQEPTYSVHLNTDYESNILRVAKKGNTLHFLINGHEVYDMPYEPFVGTRIGFQIYKQISITADNIRVYN